MAQTLDGATQQVRRMTAKKARLYAAQERHGNRYDGRSRGDIIADIGKRADLLKKVRARAEKTWPDAQSKYQGYLVDAFSAMYAVSDAHDSKLLQEMR